MANLKDVVRATAKYYGVSQRDLRDPTVRVHTLTPIRHLAFYLALKHTDCSGAKIAAFFKKKRNSSVFNARAKIEAQLATDPKIKLDIEGVEKEL